MGIDNDNSLFSAASELRHRAEEQLKAKVSETDISWTNDDMQRLLHELQVHQIELEMQNAELCQARDDLETALDKYTDLYDFAPVSYITLDHNEAISAVNLAGASLVGGVRSRLIGRRFQQFVAATDRTTFTDFLGAVLISQVKETCEVALLNKKNKPVIVQIEAMATASGQEFRLALIDITERKSQEAQFMQAQKMETVGFLAGEIAHNFNNILNVIIGYGSLSEKNMKKDDPLRINMTQIIEAADKGANLTRSLLNFSRKQPIKPHPVDVNEIIRNVETFLKTVIGEDILLETVCSEEILKVTADSGELEQVVINLATNAQHAMPDGGKLSILTEAIDIDPDFIRLHGLGEPGKYALISLTDIGTGMNQETVRRIFEPFFSTIFYGRKGTGLGLSIVYSIIRQHNGFIDVRSKPDKGTTFKIYLPLTDADQGTEEQVA